ncbi:PaaI family thioesterase [Sagittula sp. NFXS13]|uniref:Uncharacterized protein (TIGR00369 family) n=1 Tax=Sagittula marina TaxID=943940 RepID=A0A7W6DM73_9RHOB|nr:PaaI family thioesterase [Sagittula marina]MBB3985149.1 uncharacterized protein (TIGR00369 family) [Sagittula marina]
MEIIIGREEMSAYLEEVFPQVTGMFGIDHMEPGLVRMRLHNDERHLRPGGTVSGPAMFSLADVAAYVAVMMHVGEEALAVTTHCSIDFMRKPVSGVDIVAEGRVLKLGRALAVIDVLLYSEGNEQPVAHASLTYSIPPKRAER